MEQRKENCIHHGEYIAKVDFIFGTELASMCPECEKISREKKLAEEQKEKQEKETKALKNARIAKRFENSTLDNYVCNTERQKNALETCKNYLANFETNLKTGQGLFLCGTYGTGKTHLAIAILKEVLKKHSGVYVKTLEMIRDIRSSYHVNSKQTEQEIIDKYVNKDLLVIDEIGVQYGTDNEKILIFDVINGRYENYKPTIIISNLSIKEIISYLSERVFDRLKGSKESLIVFDWESYRKNNV